VVPRLTIGLPVHNGEQYPTESLDVLLRQSYQDYELIIGGAIAPPGSGSYHEYLIGWMLGMGLGMPGGLQPIAIWNPMSALAAACRELFGNPNPAAAVDAWPMQHPELAVVCWSVAMLLVFAPLAVRQFRRKVLG
jgi:hypothetical protein